eukprot:jgi/Ulvmu1/12355/UM009_0001.1
MGIFGTVKKWIWGDDQADEKASPETVPRAVVRSLPVLSDALSTPVGGMQGLAWFLSSFVCDEWGQLANELFDTSSKGSLQQIPGRVAKQQIMTVDCSRGVITVQLKRKTPVPAKATEGSRAPSKPQSKSKGRPKGKRDKKR